jgi:tetratricopeptide (TPR) repeat protein
MINIDISGRLIVKTAEQIRQEAEAAFEHGNTYFEKKEYDLAIKDYSEAIRLDPNFILAYDKRSSAYMAKDDFNMVFKEIDNIYKLDPYFRYSDIPGKCSFCGLPAVLAHGLIDGNEKKICGKCINKPKIMKIIKKNNEVFYNKISFETCGKLQGNKYEKLPINYTSHSSSRWLTKLTIEELRIKAREYEKPKLPEPVIINNIPVHKNQSTKLLEGEIFKKHHKKDVEVSNFGRVKQDDCILEQYDPQNNGYLYVDIKNGKKTIFEKVYRLIAETWIERSNIKGQSKNNKNECYNTVHHISNNGYDNRTENLMWVTEWQHAMIHPWMDINKFDFKELSDLLYSYAEINILPNEYQRIINIAKRMQELENIESKFPGKYNYWYENIIEAMKDLIKKNLNKK